MANGKGEIDVQSKVIRFRNYIPRDSGLRKLCLPRPSVEELEKQIDKEAEEAIRRAGKGDILSQIAPRRPNWDLKRDVEKKLSVLSQRTDRAIFELIRTKIKATQLATEMHEKPSERADVENSAETMSSGEREIAQSIINAVEDLDKVDEEASEEVNLNESSTRKQYHV